MQFSPRLTQGESVYCETNHIVRRLLLPWGGLGVPGLLQCWAVWQGINNISDRGWACGVLGLLCLWAMLGGGSTFNAWSFPLCSSRFFTRRAENCQDLSLAPATKSKSCELYFFTSALWGLWDECQLHGTSPS